jgi:hypothetical protein
LLYAALSRYDPAGVAGDGFGLGGGPGGGPGGFGMLPWARRVGVAREAIARRNLFTCGISLAALSNGPSGSSIGLTPVCSAGLCRATIKEGAFFNSQSLVMNIANDMCLGLEHYVATLNGPLHPTVHNHLLSSDTSDNLGLRRDNERSAMQFALYLTIDLD